jgi:hypothetical protein
MHKKGSGLRADCLSDHAPPIGRASNFLLRAQDRGDTGSPCRLKGPFESVPSPPNQPEANTRPKVLALIEGIVPIPPVLSLRNRAVLERLYKREHISAREISRLAGASRSGVLNALDRFSISRGNARPARTGHVPFGFEYVNHQLVKNDTEQAAIRMMRKQRAGGLTLRQIVGALNQAFVPTKQNGVWQANTVKEILARA